MDDKVLFWAVCDGYDAVGGGNRAFAFGVM